MAHQWRKKICAITIGAPSKKGMAQWRTITLFAMARQWRNGALNGVVKNLVGARCALSVLTRAAHGVSAFECSSRSPAMRAAMPASLADTRDDDTAAPPYRYDDCYHDPPPPPCPQPRIKRKYTRKRRLVPRVVETV
jgi:hypothetical protein